MLLLIYILRPVFTLSPKQIFFSSLDHLSILTCHCFWFILGSFWLCFFLLLFFIYNLYNLYLFFLFLTKTLTKSLSFKARAK